MESQQLNLTTEIQKRIIESISSKVNIDLSCDETKQLIIETVMFNFCETTDDHNEIKKSLSQYYDEYVIMPIVLNKITWKYNMFDTLDKITIKEIMGEIYKRKQDISSAFLKISRNFAINIMHYVVQLILLNISNNIENMTENNEIKQYCSMMIDEILEEDQFLKTQKNNLKSMRGIIEMQLSDEIYKIYNKKIKF